MKILYVSGYGDYAALMFEEEFAGQKVSDIISKLENKELKGQDDERPHPEYGEYSLNLNIVETNMSPDDPFLTFARDALQDHEGKKYHNFYLENETIGE